MINEQKAIARTTLAPTKQASTSGWKRAGRYWQQVAVYGLLLLGGFLLLYPLLWMLASSLKPEQVIFQDMGLIPRPFTLENYPEGWTALVLPFQKFFINSLLICTGSIVGNLLTCSMAAFAFARLNFRFKKLWFALMLLTIMLPGHVTLIPRYIMFRNFGWIDTYLPLVIPKFLAVESFFIFLNVQFIRSLPLELDDAAKVDGAGFFQIFYRVIMPLCVPALITTAIFTFIWNWDDFFSQMIFVNSIDKFTAALALRTFLDGTGRSSYGPLFAMSILSMVPAFVFFFSAQRYLIEGIATTGLKG